VHHARVCCAVLRCGITWTGTNESFQLHRTGMSYIGHGWVELQDYVDVSFPAERGSNYDKDGESTRQRSSHKQIGQSLNNFSQALGAAHDGV
jgi:hypothetical protein